MREERLTGRPRGLYHYITKFMAADELTKSLNRCSASLREILSAGTYTARCKARFRTIEKKMQRLDHEEKDLYEMVI